MTLGRSQAGNDRHSYLFFVPSHLSAQLDPVLDVLVWFSEAALDSWAMRPGAVANKQSAGAHWEFINSSLLLAALPLGGPSAGGSSAGGPSAGGPEIHE